MNASCILRHLRLPLVALGCFVMPLIVTLAQQPPVVPESVRPPATAVVGEAGPPPVNLQPPASDADIWAQIRQGVPGSATIGDPLAPLLIQSEGEVWRDVRGGPYRAYAGWFLIGIIVVIAVFFLLRGRIRLEHPATGIRIQRFNFFERFTHWLTAISFIVLGITGLSLMYGRELVIPLVGKEAFALWSIWGKTAHNYLAFGFMLGVILMFVQWVWYNIPGPQDLVWLVRGGGLFGGSHPPAKKFNGGQKIVFWLVILGGLSLSLSGLQLLFPYQFHFFRDTFATLNAWFGTELPTQLSPLAEQQLAVIWHGIVGVFMIGVILSHIYIGSLGMEGAFDAMWEGQVDLEWAREHHSLWVEELERRGLVAQPGSDRKTALLASALLMIAAPAQALTSAEVAERIATEYGVEVLRVAEVERDGQRLYLVTVMFPAGAGNAAFQIGTLLVDRDTGRPVPQLRHRADGYELPPPAIGAPGEAEGERLRQESFGRDRIR